MEKLDVRTAVRLACQGDPQAFAELHRQFARRVLGLCRHMLGSQENAEDACGEVFLRLPDVIASYNGSVPFERWLFSIASHHCIDLLRRRQREQRWISDQDAEPLPVAVSADSPLNELIRQERRDAVREAIARLPEKYRV